jgi:hypothetical protein
MAAEPPGEMRIGRVLSEARERAGLDLRTVEQRTKIRLKYLSALEHEDWAALPSAAYAKGFLRTYGELLGLDSEVLVDEYRRQVETAAAAPSYPLSDKVLERRRRPGEPERGPRIGLIAAVGTIAIVALLLVLGLTGGDDDGGEDQPRRAANQERDRDRDASREGASQSPVTLSLAARDPVEVCLVGDEQEVLIDGQVLTPGSRDKYTADGFQLRFPSGFDPDQVVLELDGERERLPAAKGPVAFRIAGGSAERRKTAPGKRCP